MRKIFQKFHAWPKRLPRKVLPCVPVRDLRNAMFKICAKINGEAVAYHQFRKELYIIKAIALYIISAKRIQPAADDIHRHGFRGGDEIHATHDDIPLLRNG